MKPIIIQLSGDDAPHASGVRGAQQTVRGYHHPRRGINITAINMVGARVEAMVGDLVVFSPPMEPGDEGSE